jgi:hypothetical protein
VWVHAELTGQCRGLTRKMPRKQKARVDGHEQGPDGIRVGILGRLRNYRDKPRLSQTVSDISPRKSISCGPPTCTVAAHLIFSIGTTRGTAQPPRSSPTTEYEEP